MEAVKTNSPLCLPFSRLSIVDTLGKGTFGSVQLVKEKTKGGVAALKTIPKESVSKYMIEIQKQNDNSNEDNKMLGTQALKEITAMKRVCTGKCSGIPRYVGDREDKDNYYINIPGLATIDNLGCKTLDKLEENFPMINDPELLDKILNRIEELREIGENSYVVQSSLNSLQNMQTRLNRYNSVIVKRKNNNNSNNNSTLKHRHSFSVATTKTASASTTYRDRNFFASSSFHTSTTARANASVETIDGCCCCCKCHHQHINNPIDVQKMVQQQQESKKLFNKKVIY
eukprot:jgi/Orpsp1_1/1182678/evm.model.c7180000082210.1